jgi:hypothetical protein
MLQLVTFVLTQYQSHMACVVYVRMPIPISKRGVSEFLTAESYSPTEIHTRLRSVYGQEAIYVSSVGHWQQAPTSHCSETGTKGKVDALIRDDRRIRISEMCAATELENRHLWSSSENMPTEVYEQGGCRICSSSNT